MLDTPPRLRDLLAWRRRIIVGFIVRAWALGGLALLLGWVPRPSAAEAVALLAIAVVYARLDGVVGREGRRAAMGEGLLMLPPALLLGKTTEVVLSALGT